MPPCMVAMAGLKATELWFSTQTSMAAPGREADKVYSASLRDRGIALATDPSPAYGSEFSTGGGRLVRALAAMETAHHPFPVSSTAPHYRRIKSESQAELYHYPKLGVGRPLILRGGLYSGLMTITRT